MDASTFSETLLQVLRDHPLGISEYELIQTLTRNGQPGFDKHCLRDNLSLFQTHFLLFHSLYRLRDTLAAGDSDEHLDITPLCIRLVPRRQIGGTAIDHHDPLQAYYSDLSQLQTTREADVTALLGQFWQRFCGADDRRQALAVLGLQDPVDWATIKTRHRRLVMQHHPDRGGDAAHLQDINAAMDTLSRAGK